MSRQRIIQGGTNNAKKQVLTAFSFLSGTPKSETIGACVFGTVQFTSLSYVIKSQLKCF